MGRREAPVSFDVPQLGELASALRELRHRAGSRPYRALAVETNFAHSALARAASGNDLPSWELTRAFVAACEGDEDEFRELWKAAQAAVTTCREPTDDADEPSRAAPPTVVRPRAGLVEGGPEVPRLSTDSLPTIRPVSRHLAFAAHVRPHQSLALAATVVVTVVVAAALALAFSGQPTPLRQAEPQDNVTASPASTTARGDSEPTGVGHPRPRASTESVQPGGAYPSSVLGLVIQPSASMPAEDQAGSGKQQEDRPRVVHVVCKSDDRRWVWVTPGFYWVASGQVRTADPDPGDVVKRVPYCSSVNWHQPAPEFQIEPQDTHKPQLLCVVDPRVLLRGELDEIVSSAGCVGLLDLAGAANVGFDKASPNYPACLVVCMSPSTPNVDLDKTG